MKMYSSIINKTINPNFNISFINKKFKTTNNFSYFKNNLNERISSFSYDVSNQKVLGNIDVYGEVKQLNFFQGNFYVEQKPGVWVHKQYTVSKNLHFAVAINGKNIKFTDQNHDFDTDLIADSLPRFIHRYQEYNIVLIPFCPILKDKKPSMLVYQIYIENLTDHNLTINQFEIPKYQKKYSDQFNVIVAQANLINEVVKPHEYTTFSIGLIDPDAYSEINVFEKADTAKWLEETIDYYKKIYGDLQLEDNRLPHLFNRAIYQSLSAFAENQKGESVGSHWGSTPATEQIWNKDMFYSTLPSVFFDARLCQKQILWFTKYGVRFKSKKFKGGIEHSLSNSMSAIILAGLYYEYTDDLSFFVNHPVILQKARQIIDTEVSTKVPGDVMLFSSTWISDAYSLGKYHTGSNICFWKACDSLARIYQGLGKLELANYYEKIAGKVKKAILENMTYKGHFGEQFLEGIGDKEKEFYDVNNYDKPILDQGMIFLTDVITDQKIDLKMHDGEESDTTMIPFYGFLDLKDPKYQNSMKFAASTYNPTYGANIRGIRWGDKSGATFPGFITVLMGFINDKEQRTRQLNELLHLSDLDGSWWWWPYDINGKPGDVYRDIGCGKCGWASGTFVSLFVTQFLGIQVKNNTLNIRPLSHFNYCWENAHIGNITTNISCHDNEIIVTNLSGHDINISQCNESEQYLLQLKDKKTVSFKRSEK